MTHFQAPDQSTADIIVVSSNNIAYRLHKKNLSFHSGIFNDLLNMADGDSESQERLDGLPVIRLTEAKDARVTETAQILDIALPLVYNIPHPYVCSIVILGGCQLKDVQGICAHWPASSYHWR